MDAESVVYQSSVLHFLPTPPPFHTLIVESSQPGFIRVRHPHTWFPRHQKFENHFPQISIHKRGDDCAKIHISNKDIQSVWFNYKQRQKKKKIERVRVSFQYMSYLKTSRTKNSNENLQELNPPVIKTKYLNYLDYPRPFA